MSRVVVKPLEWKLGHEAKTVVGTYEIGRIGGEWTVTLWNTNQLAGRIASGTAADHAEAFEAAKAAAQKDYEGRILSAIVTPDDIQDGRRFALRDRVAKVTGSSWHGRVVGFYSTELTPVGYCVESEREPGSVQIYPENALKPNREAPK